MELTGVRWTLLRKTRQCKRGLGRRARWVGARLQARPPLLSPPGRSSSQGVLRLTLQASLHSALSPRFQLKWGITVPHQPAQGSKHGPYQALDPGPTDGHWGQTHRDSETPPRQQTRRQGDPGTRDTFTAY